MDWLYIYDIYFIQASSDNNLERFLILGKILRNVTAIIEVVMVT